MMLNKQKRKTTTPLGQSLAEYALIGALILVVCVLAMTHIGNSVNTMLTNFAAGFTGG